MASITELEQELALANRRLTEIHAEIGRQRRLVHRLEKAGDDATEAESLLQVVQWILEAMHSHRELILRELAKAPGEEVG